MRMRRISAFATSLTLHLLIGLAAFRHAPLPAVPPLPPTARPRVTFFVPPVDDATYPGLKPLDTHAEDAALEKATHASPLAIDHLIFDVAKVAKHARVL